MQSVIPLKLIWFYCVSDDIKTFLMTIGVIGGITLLIATIGYMIDNDRLLPRFVRYLSLVLGIIFLSVSIPSQKMIYTMIVASQLTQQNIKLMNGDVKSTIDYISQKTNEIIKENSDK